MKTYAWIIGAALGVTIGAPSVAHAHGNYLQRVSDTVGAEIAAPACELPGMVCGLCHQPIEGDRLENIVVGFPEIETTVRNGPFYESLTGEGGWGHSAHMADMNAHIDDNLMLLDPALMTLLSNDTDSDGDGVGDLEELSLGYNPLLAYDPGDPAISQICGAAGPFPEPGSESSGGEMTTGGSGGDDTTGDPPTTGGTGETTDPDTGADADGTGNASATGNDSASASASAGSGDTGGTGDTTAGGGDDGGGGCRIGGMGQGGGALGVLMLLGLVARRRRSA